MPSKSRRKTWRTGISSNTSTGGVKDRVYQATLETDERKVVLVGPISIVFASPSEY